MKSPARMQSPNLRGPQTRFRADSDAGSSIASRHSRLLSTDEECAPLAVELSAVVLVCLINFLDSLGGNISTPILPFYAQQFGANGAEIGQLFSIFALMQTFAMPFLSRVSDRYGRRTVLLLSVVGSMVGAFSQACASNYTQLFLARAFNGIWAGVTAVCQIYIVDVVPQDCRVEWLNYLNSASQAAILFGPSIGAGLSVLGYNVPLVTQGFVCLFSFPLVVIYLPESPAWSRLNKDPSFRKDAAKINAPTTLSKPGTYRAIGIFGLVAFSAMASQMSVVSMFALYAKDVFSFDSLHVGFVVTLGAVASIVTNIWVCPIMQRRIGDIETSIIGTTFTCLGALLILENRISVALVGFMLVYFGIALNGSAVTIASSNLTDMGNRSTVMMYVRMLKSIGAMVGPTLAGFLAVSDIGYPFYCAAIFSFLGAVWQATTWRVYEALLDDVKHGDLKEKRIGIGLEEPVLSLGKWHDEYGTPEEIDALGKYVADLLTKRHYRWVTYNTALKNFLSDSFPELETGSDEDHKSHYDMVRSRSRGLAEAQLRDLNNYA